MLIKSVAIVFAAVVALFVSAATAPKVVLTGTAQDCYPGIPLRTLGIVGVSVAAFQVSKVPTLMANLKTLDTAKVTDGASMIRKDSLSRQTYRLVNSTTALVRGISDSSGVFKLSIPATDSVVVYGTADNEDQPFYHAFKTMSGRANGSFVLDMAHGGCHP